MLEIEKQFPFCPIFMQQIAYKGKTNRKVRIANFEAKKLYFKVKCV